MKRKPLKFKNKPTLLDGIKFDSKKEAARYAELKILEKQGMIKDLSCQPRIPLFVNGVTIGHYVGDFKYWRDGEMIIEDVKSPATKTPVYRLNMQVGSVNYRP